MGFYLLSEHNRKARKHHTCTLCGKIIYTGEHCHNLVGVMDNEFQSDYYHKRCFDVINEYCSSTEENEWSHNDLETWWVCEKCDVCKHHHYDTRTTLGMCDIPDGMDMKEWCTHFEG